MFKNRDVDEVSDVDQNDIDRILQDTEDLDNDLFKDINSKSKFGLSKTLPAAILKKPNATASDSQKNISFNFENDNDKLFDGFDSLVKKPLESKPPLQKQSSTRDIFNDISDDLELFNEKKPPKASIPNKPNDSFSKSKSFKEELFGKGSFDEDANISNDGDLGKSSDDFKFGGYMPSSATSRSFKQSDGEKNDFLFDEEPRAQIRPRTSPSAGLSQTQTTTKADTNLLMRTAPVSLQKNSGNKAFDFDFDFDSLVKTKSKDKVQKTSSQATTGQKPDWLMNLNNTSPAKHSNKPIDTSIKSSIKSSFEDDGDNEANIEPLQIESTKTSFKVSENRLESKHKLLDGDEWLDSKKAPSPSKKTNIDGTHYDSNEIQSMLQKIKQLEYENQELNMQLSNQKAHYEAQIAILNESHEQRVKMMREDRETLIKHQNEAKQALQAHINTLERQNNEAFTTYKQKLDEREREFEADLDKQRRLHREVAERLKADFTEQIEKLKRQKQVEVDSIMQIGVHSKSIENVVGKIEEQARTLDVMQQRVERGHVSNLVDVENQLKAKEEQLKAQESRLFKQQKEYENEIRLLNDMVQKLENHLAEQTKTASEERWKGKQQEKKMEALQEALMNEQRIVMEKLARERNDIERAKDDILVEQKRLMQQIYEEKRKNAEERATLEASIAAYKDKTHKDSLANISIEAELTVNSKRLKDEKTRLEEANLSLKERETALRQEKLALDEKKQELEIRAAKLEKMSIDVNHKYLETEELYLKASREKDAQMRYLKEANSIKQNHDSRLNQIQAQLSVLSQKEVEVNREKIDVYRQRQELEKFKSTLKCNKCQDPIRDFGFLDFKIPLTSTLANTVKYPSQNLLASSIKNSNSDLEESKILRQLKLQAFKDKQFLNQEKQFIDTLRSNSGLDSNLRSISMNQLNSTFV